MYYYNLYNLKNWSLNESVRIILVNELKMNESLERMQISITTKLSNFPLQEKVRCAYPDVDRRSLNEAARNKLSYERKLSSRMMY